MPHPDHVIRLDTGAFRVARTARVARGAAYWIVLCVAAAAVAVGIAVVATTVGHDPTVLNATASAIDLAGAPAPETSPVAIWNASPVDGAANRLKIRLAKLGYPAEAAKSHGLPKGGLKGTWVFYTPGNAGGRQGRRREPQGQRRAARAPHRRHHAATQLAPAVVLVVVGHP